MSAATALDGSSDSERGTFWRGAGLSCLTVRQYRIVAVSRCTFDQGWCGLLRFGCTTDAANCGGIQFQSLQRQGIPADVAIAEFIVIDAHQGGVEAPRGDVAGSLGRFSDGLLLQGVHAAQAANGLLIERYRFLTVTSQDIFPAKCIEIGQDAFAETGAVFLIHLHS